MDWCDCSREVRHDRRGRQEEGRTGRVRGSEGGGEGVLFLPQEKLPACRGKQGTIVFLVCAVLPNGEQLFGKKQTSEKWGDISVT